MRCLSFGERLRPKRSPKEISGTLPPEPTYHCAEDGVDANRETRCNCQPNRDRRQFLVWPAGPDAENVAPTSAMGRVLRLSRDVHSRPSDVAEGVARRPYQEKLNPFPLLHEVLLFPLALSMSDRC